MEREGPAGNRSWPRHRVVPVLAGSTVAAAMAVTCYSSCFGSMEGIAEAVRAAGVYARRGFEPGVHGEPWHYYLQLLGFSASDGVVWTEGLVLGLAGIGAVLAWTKRHGGFWPRYICLYSALTVVMFSAVRYKTPWNLLPFYGGFVLLAGSGAAALLGRMRSRAARMLLAAALLAACAQLGVQAWRANFRYPADQRNPYVYAQTSPDFLRLVDRVAGVSAAHPDRARMLVAVVAGPYEQWPLPWYLRGMERVGYWTDPAQAGPLDRKPFVIAAPAFAGAVAESLGDGYMSEFFGLRPGVLLTVFIERGLWDRYLTAKMGSENGVGRYFGPPPLTMTLL
jgi:predicted membrane-bound mannosyltransferase